MSQDKQNKETGIQQGGNGFMGQSMDLLPLTWGNRMGGGSPVSKTAACTEKMKARLPGGIPHGRACRSRNWPDFL